MQEEHDDLQKKFHSLPEELKEALTSVDLSEKLQLIGKNNSLHLDQVDLLMEEIGFVMLGETKLDEFQKKVASKLELPEEKIVPLIKSVDDEVFKPIRSALIALHPTPSPTIIKQPEVERPTLNSNISGADYDMSRNAILSAIENPIQAEVKIAPVIQRTIETSDPKEYLLRRDEVVRQMQKRAVPTPGQQAESKKNSLLEEAVLIAQKKADGGSTNTDSLSTKVVVPSKLVPTLNASPSLNRPSLNQAPVINNPPTFASRNQSLGTPTAPADKLNKPVQIQRTVTNLSSVATPATAPLVPKPSVDPYREPV